MQDNDNHIIQIDLHKAKAYNTYIAPQTATAAAAALLCHKQSERVAYRP